MEKAQSTTEQQKSSTETEAKTGSKEVQSISPRWPAGFKLIIMLLLIIGFFLLIFTYKEYVIMVMIAFLIAYLLKPLIRLAQKKLRISWGLSSAIVFLLFFITVVGIAIAGSSFLIGQGEAIFNIIKDNLGSLNDFLADMSGRSFTLGPLQLKLPALTTEALSTDLLSQWQKMLGSAGTAVTKTVGFVGTTIFKVFMTFLLSLFLIGDGNTKKEPNLALVSSGYAADIQRFQLELGRIWNAFMRGEFTVVGTAILVYSIVLAIFGFPFFLGLAVLAGIGRLVPYIGAWITWITFGTAAFTLRPTPYGMQPWAFAILVLVVCFVIDQILDNVLQPKVMGNALSVHPAAIMISALISAQLFGFLGLILNAPVIASIKLIGRYTVRKLLDEDPWAGLKYEDPTWKRKHVWYKKISNSAIKGIIYTYNSLKNWIRNRLK